jgi:hypothetical protein
MKTKPDKKRVLVKQEIMIFNTEWHWVDSAEADKLKSNDKLTIDDVESTYIDEFNTHQKNTNTIIVTDAKTIQEFN